MGVVGDFHECCVVVLGDKADAGLVVIRVVVQPVGDSLDDVHGTLGNAHLQQRLPRDGSVLGNVVEVACNPDIVVEISQGITHRNHMVTVGPLELVLLPVVGHLGQDLRSLDGESRVREFCFSEFGFRHGFSLRAGG